MNILYGTVESSAAGLGCRIGPALLELPADAAVRPALASYVGRQVAVGLRPEHLQDAATAGPAFGGRLHGEVRATELLGSEVLAHVEITARPVVTSEVIEIAADVDEFAAAKVEHEAASETATLLGRFDRASGAAPGKTIDVAVSTKDLYFFDPGTGSSILA